MNHHSKFQIQNFRFFFLSFLFLASVSVVAQKAVPELWGQRIHDEAHALKSETIDQLEKQLAVYEDSTTNQIAVLIVQSLDGDVLEDFSIRVAEKWKLGQKGKDNGILLLVSVDDHKMRIEVGRGLQGVLTDAQSNRIIRNEMAPSFRRGDFDAGIILAIQGIIKSIGGEYKADEEVAEAGTSDLSLTEKIFYSLFIFGMLGLFTAFAIFSKGCAGWGLYAFLIPFYLFFPWVVIGYTASFVLLAMYAVGVPIAKIFIPRSKWGKDFFAKEKTKYYSGGGGGSYSSGGSSWSSSDSSWGSSDSSSFSGGGGSFDGGGSSGSW